MMMTTRIGTLILFVVAAFVAMEVAAQDAKPGAKLLQTGGDADVSVSVEKLPPAGNDSSDFPLDPCAPAGTAVLKGGQAKYRIVEGKCATDEDGMHDITPPVAPDRGEWISPDVYPPRTPDCDCGPVKRWPCNPCYYACNPCPPVACEPCRPIRPVVCPNPCPPVCVTTCQPVWTVPCHTPCFPRLRSCWFGHRSTFVHGGYGCGNWCF